MKIINWLKKIGLELLFLICLLLIKGLVFEKIFRANADKISHDGILGRLKIIASTLLKRILEVQLWCLKQHLTQLNYY
ncbi:hypothetical protein EZ428_12475 [Pedobacter frigiditerrae]|uniref:Uncharacterized protein n=1 Tax=Pedobacter frigiditerrae TaxID=2530452 RepID=A0A4R0MSW6_9SPHI|nr:hypothetical protein [Pedobacter frigiditerrae]TCC90098.1 hypothetical protein EZ428_12475 [Pedobacter frigiditerrae]